MNFHPVIVLPSKYTVNDFSYGYDPDRTRLSDFDIGKYNEKRPGMYPSGFATRDVHMGIDIGAPVGTEVYAFCEGEIYSFGYNGGEGDYGYTIITKHLVDGEPLFALHGHLSAKSVSSKVEDQGISRGEVIGWIGDKHENGDWNPHLHFQLSLLPPESNELPGLVNPSSKKKKERSFDIPGVVSEKDREAALKIYPDPRIVLGPLY